MREGGHYLVGVGDRTGSGEIQLLSGALDEADALLAEGRQSETATRVSSVGELILGCQASILHGAARSRASGNCLPTTSFKSWGNDGCRTRLELSKEAAHVE